MRARGIPFQKCETDLVTKAEWHMAFNGGLVPVLETPDGELMRESDVIMSFAENLKEGGPLPLWPHELNKGDLAATMETCQHKLTIEEHKKVFNTEGKLYRLQMNRFEIEEDLHAVKEVFVRSEAWFKEKLGDKPFLSGRDKPMMVDIHYFPFWERVVMMEGTCLQRAFDWFDVKNTMPTIYAWVHRFREVPEFADIVINMDIWKRQTAFQDGNPPGVKYQLTLRSYGL